MRGQKELHKKKIFSRQQQNIHKHNKKKNKTPWKPGVGGKEATFKTQFLNKQLTKS